MTLSIEDIHRPMADFFLTQFQTQGGNPILFRFDKFGSVLSDQDFIDPNHPALGYIPALAREKFSDLVNHIPIDAGDGMNIFLSTDSIDNTYFFRLLSPSLPYIPDNSNINTKNLIIHNFSLIKSGALKQWENLKNESLTGLMLQYMPSLATPEDWYDKSKDDIWTSHSFQITETNPVPIPGLSTQMWRLKPENVVIPPRNGELDINNRLHLHRYLSNNAPTETLKASSISIAFDYCLVHIRRPWYVDAFIDDKSWCVPTVPKGQVTSSGPAGNLPLMPICFVEVRNLNIEANWAAEDIATASHATDFGPFKVTANIVNNKLSYQGTQIIGWTLQKMPDLPPNDPPSSEPGSTLCTVTIDNLNIRSQPNSQSTIIATYPYGTALNFIEVVEGENVDGNPYWGHSKQGHYFWLGGTDHPNG